MMDPTDIVFSIATALATVAAGFERYRSQRANARAQASAEVAAEAKQEQAVKDQIIAGKEELCRIAREAGEAWKKRYDEAHTEFSEYRNATHARAQEAQALILRFTAENAELRNKTDVTPILEHQRTQSEINSKIIQALDEILFHFQSENPRLQVKPKPTKTK